MAYPLHIVIVSWAGRHASARVIAAAVAPEADRLTVVYSHPEGQVDSGAGFRALTRREGDASLAV